VSAKHRKFKLRVKARYGLFRQLWVNVAWRRGTGWRLSHRVGDWAESFLFGVPDSGVVFRGRLLAPVLHGPAWLTG
jgi:hypothetical protein